MKIAALITSVQQESESFALRIGRQTAPIAKSIHKEIIVLILQQRSLNIGMHLSYGVVERIGGQIFAELCVGHRAQIHAEMLV